MLTSMCRPRLPNLRQMMQVLCVEMQQIVGRAC